MMVDEETKLEILEAIDQEEYSIQELKYLISQLKDRIRVLEKEQDAV